MPDLLIIDIGSSSVRGMLVNEALQPTVIAQFTYGFTTDADGMAITDAEMLRGYIEQCIDASAGGKVQAVGIASFAGNLLGLDRNGLPITPVYTYADTRNADDVTDLRQQLDVAAVHQRTGCLIHTAYNPSRLRWLQRTDPERVQQVHYWVDVATYCYGQWFGVLATSYSLASWSGLVNRATLTWDVDWLTILGLDGEKLPLLVDATVAMPALQAPYALRWPHLAEVPFFPAIGDGAAANLGVGAFDESHVALTVGTTAALRRVSNKSLPAVPAGLWSYRVTAEQHLIGGATSEGGNLYEWARQALNLPDAEMVETALAERLPDIHGLTFLPLIAGERSPGYNPFAEGVIMGIHRGTTALDMLQASLEGVAIRLSLIADLLIDRPVTIMAGGSALQKSPAFAQMLANAFNCSLRVVGVKETTARGTALLLRSTLEGKAWDEYPMPQGKTIEPDPAAVRRMDSARQRQQALYETMSTLWQKNTLDF